MSSIHIMSDTLASQVAAGEVVDRPASVVKELVENSLDAGAKTVRVEIRRGGISLMKVTDDGCGMGREDASLALLRHATSKLARTEDLFHITQLGFRGEALPSIASISRLRLATRRHDDVEGTEIICEGGEQTPPRDTGTAPGTTIEISDLFYNTPARRKFLKSEETEAGHIEHQFKLHALAFPGVRFMFTRDGQAVYDAVATTDMRQRIADFAGRTQADRLISILPTEGPGIGISGYLLPLSDARRNRRQQYIFLNRRPIDDKLVARAIRDGFGGFPTGLHPALYLYIEMDPALVDVNVHPAKREVRFRRPGDLVAAIITAIGNTLAAHARAETAPAPTLADKRPASPRPAISHATPASPRPPLPAHPSANIPPSAAAQPAASFPAAKKAAPAIRPILPSPSPLLPPSQRELDIPVRHLPSSPSPVNTSRPVKNHPHFRHLGTLKEQYALFENPEGLVLLSPRAARERILFEQFIAAHKKTVASQLLLAPVLLDMDARDLAAITQLLPHFEQSGFRIAPFGHKTLRVEAVPALLRLDRIEEFVSDLIHNLTRGDTRIQRHRNPYEPFAIQIAREYARREEIAPILADAARLLTDLLACEIPYCTPSGKPTLIPYAMSEITRKFQAN